MVIALVVVPSLFCLVTDREYWPYSPYPMYSGLAGGARNQIVVFAVPAAPGESEFRLLGGAQIHPFDRSRLGQASRRVMRATERDGEVGRLDAALNDLHARYEAHRVAGLHDGPPIRAVRIYQQLWDDVDPRIIPSPPPDERRLVGESDLQAGGAP
jgi:hypothetical protein